ncbi:hypothetical protein D3C74_367780 [compost metagenome]
MEGKANKIGLLKPNIILFHFFFNLPGMPYGSFRPFLKKNRFHIWFDAFRILPEVLYFIRLLPLPHNSLAGTPQGIKDASLI